MRFADENTDMETGGELPAGIITGAGFAHSMASGKLEVSFEAKSLNHARYLYDMLMPLTPILIALSASSPIHKSQCSDLDHSWEIF